MVYANSDVHISLLLPLLDEYVIECHLLNTRTVLSEMTFASYLQPDIYVFNRSAKKLFIYEVSTAFGEGIDAHERKTRKYENLQQGSR